MDTPQSTTSGRGINTPQSMQQTQDKAHEGIDKAAEAAKPAVDRLSSTAHTTVDKLSDYATQAKSMFSERASQFKDVQSQVVADTRQRIREKPMAALAIAAAAGFLIRQMLSGRSRRD